MSDVNVSFGYSPLVDFMSSGYTRPKEINVIPVYKILDSGDVYGVLALDKSLSVTSLGSGLHKGKTLVTFIADSLRKNSLGVINLNDEYIKDNSYVAHSTCYDVYSGRTDINRNYQLIIFVEISVKTIDDLHNVILDFRETFTSKISRNLDYENDKVALVYMDCTSMFYLLRYTSWKIVDTKTHQTYIFSVEDDGFPALDFITSTYKCDPSKGEIPMTDKPDRNANRSPEIDFYSRIDFNLGIAFTAYSVAGLAFMER